MEPLVTMPLCQLAKVIRSKNAGPFEVTIDLLFATEANYRLVKDSRTITPEVIAAAYQISVEEVHGVYFWDAALAMKVTLHRATSAGAVGDNDCYGAQQHAPLLSLEISVKPEDLSWLRA